MATGTGMRRIEIIIEALELSRLLGVIEKAGATGYTVMPHVQGKGRRGEWTDLGFSPILKNVLVMVLAPAGVAEAIVRDVQRSFVRAAGILAVTPVETYLEFGRGPER